MTLNNGRQDPSLLDMCLGYGLFRKAGLDPDKLSVETDNYEPSVLISAFEDNSISILANTLDVETVSDSSTALCRDPRECAGHFGEIDDARVRYEQCRHSANVRFAFAELFRREQAQAVEDDHRVLAVDRCIVGVDIHGQAHIQVIYLCTCDQRHYERGDDAQPQRQFSSGEFHC